MNYLVRSVRGKDLKDLYNLSGGSNLFNLPHDRGEIRKKIEKSIDSFHGRLSKKESEYFFVVESLRSKKIIGCSQILGKHGTKKHPFYSLKVSRESRWNPFLKKELNFTTFKLTKNKDGPTEIGGLIVAPGFRKRKDRIGELISYSRFMYIALRKEQFEKNVCAFMQPVLVEGGVSPFWESFGARLTGCSYDKVFDIIQKGQKEDLLSLFPKEGEKFYLCLMDARMELVMSRVHDEAYPAFKLLKKIGFQKTDHIDPFDGGACVIAKVHNLETVKYGREFIYKAQLKAVKKKSQRKALVGFVRNNEYRGGRVSYFQSENEVSFSEDVKKVFKLSEGEKVFLF